MAGDGDEYEIDGAEQLNQPITRLHFNALRDHLRQEFRASIESLEEKQDRMSEDLQQLMGNVNHQLTQNLAAMQVNIVAQVVRELRQATGDASVHGDETEGTNGEVAALNAQGRRNHVADNTNNVVAGRGNNVRDAPFNGRGRGRGRGNMNHGYIDDEFDNEDRDMFRNAGFRQRGNFVRDEERFGKLKFTMPKFEGGSDPEAYLTWELKVDKIFRMHNYSEEKKLAMASLEFEDYALIWWEQVQRQREEGEGFPIATWAEMKREMRARFIPRHYRRDIFDKLQNLRQGKQSVEEYHKEMEKAIIRADIQEDEEQSMARFLYGLNSSVKRIVELQPYRNVIELVHLASKAERQLQDDSKLNKSTSFTTRTTASGSKFVPQFNVGRGITTNSVGGNRSNTRSGGTETSREKGKSASSSSSSIGSTSKSRDIECFKCKGRGHMIKDCPNNRTVLVTKEGEYESASDLEDEVSDATLDDEEHNYCDYEQGASLVVTKVLSVQMKDSENCQRHNLFQTRGRVQDKVAKVIRWRKLPKPCKQRDV
ncbi:unnamed protein product [Rhodiola kirilowii]